MARRVVVVGVHRGSSEVDPMDIIQEIGRAGRKGLDKKGDAYVLMPRSKFIGLREKYKTSPPIVSRMITNDKEGIDNVVFHAVSEVAENSVCTIREFREWYNRSLAAYQGCELSDVDAKTIFDLLVSIRAVKIEDGLYKATGLGKIASVMYMNPYDVFAWYMNFGKIIKTRWITDNYAISWAFANCRMFDTGFVSAEDTDCSLSFLGKCREIGLQMFNTRASSGAAFAACLGDRFMASEVRDNRVDLLRMDIERIVTTVSMISGYAKWSVGDFFQRLLIRFKYGVNDSLVDLCKLRGIGAVRAGMLYSAGIKNRDDMVRNKDACVKALGGSDHALKIYEDALSKG